MPKLYLAHEMAKHYGIKPTGLSSSAKPNLVNGFKIGTKDFTSAQAALMGGLIGSTTISTGRAADGADGAFNTTLTIPADEVAAGGVIPVSFLVLIGTSDASSPGTLDLVLRLNGQAVATIPQQTPSTGVSADEFALVEGHIIAASSTTAAFVGKVIHNIGGTYETLILVSTSIADLDFTASQILDVTCTWGGSSADDEALLVGLIAKRN
jgi:hypothetical protein